MIDFNELFLVVLSILFHEAGHAILLNYFEAFNGFKMRWWGIECLIDKTVEVNISKIVGLLIYFSGFIFSFIVFIPWLALGYSGELFILYQMGISVLDFYYSAKLIFASSSFAEQEGMQCGFHAP